jgi:hypothetical protein
MNKKNAVAAIIILIVVLYSITIILGLIGMGILSVYTDKNEYGIGEKITISTKNSGIALLCGIPEWKIYKINNETPVYWNEIKGPQCKWPQGYFGVETRPLVWEPQKEGTYKIVATIYGVRINTSDSVIITIK